MSSGTIMITNGFLKIKNVLCTNIDWLLWRWNGWKVLVLGSQFQKPAWGYQQNNQLSSDDCTDKQTCSCDQENRRKIEKGEENDRACKSSWLHFCELENSYQLWKLPLSDPVNSIFHLLIVMIDLQEIVESYESPPLWVVFVLNLVFCIYYFVFTIFYY